MCVFVFCECTYVLVCLVLHVCMPMYACMGLCICIYTCTYLPIHSRLYVSLYLCVYVCMYVRTYVRMCDPCVDVDAATLYHTYRYIGARMPLCVCVRPFGQVSYMPSCVVHSDVSSVEGCAAYCGAQVCGLSWHTSPSAGLDFMRICRFTALCSDDATTLYSDGATERRLTPLAVKGMVLRAQIPGTLYIAEAVQRATLPSIKFSVPHPCSRDKLTDCTSCTPAHGNFGS